MYSFSYAFAPWQSTKKFLSAAEILAYLRGVVDDHGLARYIRYGRHVVSADYDSAASQWTLREAAGPAARTYTARHYFSCVGYYDYDGGHRPTFPGEARFGGKIIHPQDWPRTDGADGATARAPPDYAGKRVVVVGSGATAVTLAPVMARDAASLVVLQRTPSFIAGMPMHLAPWRATRALAWLARWLLPLALSSGLRWLYYKCVRWWHICWGLFMFNMCRRFPAGMKRVVLGEVAKHLPRRVMRHMTPPYNPWEQRFCLCPDGDFYKAVADGSLRLVTAHIDRFDAAGIRLRPLSDRARAAAEAHGEPPEDTPARLDADLVVVATGLRLQFNGGIALRVDGAAVRPSDKIVYRGMMFNGVPNFFFASGYTNASWTLKVDLTAQAFCRLLGEMDARGASAVCPRWREGDAKERLLDFSSGYIVRNLENMPKQGAASPWKMHQNYFLDMLDLRWSSFDDGVLEWSLEEEEGGTKKNE